MSPSIFARDKGIGELIEKQTDRFKGMGEKRCLESDRSELKLHPLYTATAELDRDPSGVLYSAKYEAEVQKVLVKSMNLGTVVDREAQADSPPECLRLLDLVTGISGRELVVLEFPKASSLKRVLDRQGNMTVRPAVSVIVKILSALSYLHERQRLFRTLSSGAVFLSRVSGGRLKIQLAYFGLKSDDRPLNHIAYRPPEWMEPGHTPEVADDLFAAGVLLYEMLFGLMPFQAVKKGPASPTAASEALYLPAAFATRHPLEAAVLRRTLHENPARRFTSADAIMDALQSDGVPLTAGMKSFSLTARRLSPRSSIPTVPSPPRDSLLTETLAVDDDITKPYSIPAIEAYRSFRSDAPAPPRNNVLRLIAAGTAAMLVPIVLWLLFGERMQNSEKKIDPVFSPASLNTAGLGNGKAVPKASTVPDGKEDVDLSPLSEIKEEKKMDKDTEIESNRASKTASQSDRPGAIRGGKRKQKTERPEKGGPSDNLSSNPFPLKNNPFPTGE